MAVGAGMGTGVGVGVAVGAGVETGVGVGVAVGAGVETGVGVGVAVGSGVGAGVGTGLTDRPHPNRRGATREKKKRQKAAIEISIHYKTPVPKREPSYLSRLGNGQSISDLRRTYSVLLETYFSRGPRSWTRLLAVFTVAGEDQEKVADEKTLVLLKRFSGISEVQKARVESIVLKKSKRDSTRNSMGSTSQVVSRRREAAGNRGGIAVQA